mgnify:CR=1 FL=1
MLLYCEQIIKKQFSLVMTDILLGPAEGMIYSCRTI